MVPIFDEFKTLNDFKNLRIAFHGCISNIQFMKLEFSKHRKWIGTFSLINSFYTVFVNYGRLKEVVMEDHIGFE